MLPPWLCKSSTLPQLLQREASQALRKAKGLQGSSALLAGASRVKKAEPLTGQHRQLSFSSAYYSGFQDSQGDPQLQTPWDLRTQRPSFPHILRKPWQPLSLTAAAKFSVGRQTYALKTGLQEQKLIRNHLAGCLESCSAAGSSPPGILLRFFNVLYLALLLLQKHSELPFSASHPANTATMSPRRHIFRSPSKAWGLFLFQSLDLPGILSPSFLVSALSVFSTQHTYFKHTDTNETGYHSAFLTGSAF